MAQLLPFNRVKDRSVDWQANQANEKEELLEEFIRQEMPFIRSVAGKTLGRHVEVGSEEELTAMESFVEAVKSYTPEKGSFLPFCRLVIGRRMIDWMRQEEKNRRFIPVEPEELGRYQDNRESAGLYAVTDRGTGASDAAEEIQRLSLTLAEYGIRLRDIPAHTPKSLKTKESCRKVIGEIRRSELLYQEMKEKKMLPLKIIEKNTEVPRKIMERHRKYIIAVVEIQKGNYPCLKPYIQSMEKEE